ncbi:hypothetical protein H0264_09320 [Nocardia huaxiensis]|uniref:Resolvase/invertase-type recombinase catalytic domain-containing protein n=1 Tax=Nocardia huaxiensis TaxID=2755382 RepID=A0A7D6ZJW6_9NOCA|nr:hypothetical protein [Nocardia huaxiensis]QLY32427.1 hypothetical protein H0264_09320 [Nocardia huaxiensis]
MTNYVIGFLRPDVSGAARHQDESRIHALAAECGWSVILMYYGDPARPGGALINRLMNLTYTECVNEVIAPSTDHFEPGDLSALVKVADVICTDTGTRYTVRNVGGGTIAFAIVPPPIWF